MVQTTGIQLRFGTMGNCKIERGTVNVVVMFLGFFSDIYLQVLGMEALYFPLYHRAPWLYKIYLKHIDESHCCTGDAFFYYT